MPYCDVGGGVRLYYEDFGEGPAVVFTPSGQMTHRMWEDQVGALAGDFRTIAYDWRGTGASDKPRAGYSVENAASDLSALIDRLGVAPAVLVGHGIGNHVMLLAAAKRPDLAAGLVMASAAPWFTGVRDGVRGGLAPEFLELLAGHGVAGEHGLSYTEICTALSEQFLFHRPQPPAVHQSNLEQALCWPLAVIKAYTGSLAAVDHRERLGQIRCPALVVHGRHDRKTIHDGAAYIARRIEGARLVTLEDSAHMGQIEQIKLFNTELRNFLAAVQRQRRAG